MKNNYLVFYGGVNFYGIIKTDKEPFKTNTALDTFGSAELFFRIVKEFEFAKIWLSQMMVSDIKELLDAVNEDVLFWSDADNLCDMLKDEDLDPFDDERFFERVNID